MTYRPRFVSQVQAEQWWITQSRERVDYFIEYITGKKLGKHHRIWLLNMFDPSRKLLNFVAPRESGKSTVLVYALAWYISKNPLSTNGFVSVSSHQAEQRMGMLKSLIQDDQRYRNVFPHIWVDQQMPNTQTQFSLLSTENGLAYAHWRSMVTQYGSPKDPTVCVAGRGGKAIIGSRYSGILVLDDIVDDKDTDSVAHQKVVDYIGITLLPCVQTSGKVVNIGTRWIPDDIYEILSRNQAWYTLIIPAIIYDDAGDPHSYWPEFWSLDLLDGKRKEIDNEYIFRTMYLSDPTVSTAQKFTVAHFGQDLPTPLPTFTGVYISVDLAASVSKRADWTVCAAIGVDKDKNVYLLDMTRFKAETQTVVNNICAFADKTYNAWGKMNAVLFEHVGFQSAYSQLMIQARPDLIATAVVPKGDKGYRAEVVAQWMGLGKFYINQRIEALSIIKAEWMNFPVHAHDDTLDAVSLFFQYLGLRDSGTAKLKMVKLHAPTELRPNKDSGLSDVERDRPRPSRRGIVGKGDFGDYDVTPGRT